MGAGTESQAGSRFQLLAEQGSPQTAFPAFPENLGEEGGYYPEADSFDM